MTYPIAGHFARLLPVGSYVAGYVMAPGWWEQLDQCANQAVNGDGGGTYAPTTPIIIGGSGMQIPNGATWTILAGGSLAVTGGGAGIEFTGGGGASFATGSGATFQSGSSAQWLSGALAAFQSGATAHFENGSSLTIDNGTNFGLNGNISVGATGSIIANAAGAGWFATNGSGISIQDGTNPTFATPRVRTIIQPLSFVNVNPALPSYFLCAGSEFQDVVGGTTYLNLTKLINQAAIDGFTIVCNVSSSHVPVGKASVSLVRSSGLDGSTHVVGSASVPSSISGNFAVTVAGIAGGPFTTIDDTQFNYQLQITSESGGGAQALIWYAPMISMVGITSLGVF